LRRRSIKNLLRTQALKHVATVSPNAGKAAKWSYFRDKLRYAMEDVELKNRVDLPPERR
jgi:hypothetical protein